MEARPHLIIHAGPDTGREIRISDPAGVRVGRSSKNDVVLQDPKTSRYHCRFFIKPDDGLFVADLGSANQTLVNNQPIREVRLHVADLVTLGDTVIKVIYAGTDEVAAETTPPPPAGVDAAGGGAAEVPSATAAASVDLGLEPLRPPPLPAARPWRRGPLMTALAVVLLLAIAAWLPRLLRAHIAAPAAPTAPPAPPPLEIAYEKVTADTNRIFRYQLQLGLDRHLAVTIDDTDTTHLHEEGTVRPELIAELSRFVTDSGFMTLDAAYQGIQPDTLDQWDIAVTLGRQTRRCRVINRAEPPEFQAVREKLENFAQVELGLWAVQYPPAKLVEMARQAYLDGKKLFDERDIKHANLATAIRRLKDADFFLKTIEPKPDFYPDVLKGLTDYAAELDKRYVDQNFLANRAMREKDWEQAAQELRTLCDMLGDRADPRYEEANRKLLEVESRLNVQKK